MAFEPVEHLVLDLGRNPRTGSGPREDDAVFGAAGADRHRGILRREADRVGKQVIENLHHAALVAGEVADVGVDIDLERDAIRREPVLNALGGGRDGLYTIYRAAFGLDAAGGGG